MSEDTQAIDPQSPDELLSTLEEHLADYVKAKRGKISLAESEEHLLELLVLSPVGFQVILHWDGDHDAGDGSDESGVVFNRFLIVIKMAKGLFAKPGQNLTQGTAGQESILKLVSQVRARVRTCPFPGRTEEDQNGTGVPLYKGCDAIAVQMPDKATLSYYSLRFELMTAIPVEE